MVYVIFAFLVLGTLFFGYRVATDKKRNGR